MLARRIFSTKMCSRLCQGSVQTLRLRSLITSQARWTSQASKVDDEQRTSTPSLKESISEQRQVLFPNAQKLEEAMLQKDALRQTTVPNSEWSPRSVPYKTYEKSSTANDSDDDDDEEDVDVPSTSSEATQENAVEGLQVGEEVGFRYNGPEPTIFGDWAHKGRVTDF